GCRPISVTYQPASTAIQPENVITDMARNNHGCASALSFFLRYSDQVAHQPSNTINTPTPTMTRNDQNTGATGGASEPKSFRPTTSPSQSWVRIRLASFGILMAKCVVRASSSGNPNRVRGAPFCVSQMPSIAATFAG